MRDYKQYIQEMKAKWTGKKVSYQGEIFTVVDVDYNGGLLLNKKAKYTDTTAVDAAHVKALEDMQ